MMKNIFLLTLFCLISMPLANVRGQNKPESNGGPSSKRMPPGPPPALVRVGHVRVESLQGRTDVVGRLREMRRALVSAEQPGRVIEVAADEGDAVVGQESVLVRIDDVWARISLAEAEAVLAEVEASVVEAEARADQARRDRVYLEELLNAKSAKPKEVEDARTLERAELARLDRSRADVSRAQAELERSKQQLARLTVVAPFEGFVVRKIAELGQWVDQGDQVMEIISRRQIDALIDVPENLINRIVVGRQIDVRIDPLDIEVAGTVHAVNPLGNTSARTFPVKIRMDDRDGTLKPGMSVTAHLAVQGTVDVLTIPRDALQRSQQGPGVWVDLNGAATRIPVRVLFGYDGRYAVGNVEGAEVALADRMSVVVEGAERLFPHRSLQVVPGTPPDQPSQDATP